MQPERRADSSAVIVVTNVKLRMEAQRSIPPSESSWLVTGKLYIKNTRNMSTTTVQLPAILCNFQNV